MPFLRGPPYDFRSFGPLFPNFQIPQIWPDLTELDPIRLNLNNFGQNLTKIHKFPEFPKGPAHQFSAILVTNESSMHGSPYVSYCTSQAHF